MNQINFLCILVLIGFVYAHDQQHPLIEKKTGGSCPPEGLRPMKAFNLTEFLAHPWYVQQQMIVIYQQPRDLFCTRDIYRRLSARRIELKTESKQSNKTWSRVSLDGYLEDLNEPSHMLVGPRLVPRFLRGPYWVINAGARESSTHGGYDWMIVSGGAPKNVNPANGQCRTDPWGTEDVVQVMRDYLENVGYDLSVLVPVDHRGCGYQNE